MELIKKYQHYLVVTVALLFALYITDPLWQTHNELAETASLSNNRADKMNHLLDQVEHLNLELQKATAANKLVAEYFYRSENEGSLKLEVQQKVNAIFEQANCKVDTLNWQGDTQLTDNIDRWRFKVSFNGPPICLVKLTQQIESQVPVMRFNHYSFGHRSGWQGKASQRLNGSIELHIWHYKEAV